MSHRARLLQQMDIPIWTLRRPETLKGLAAIHVDKNIQLVIICINNVITPFLHDVLRSLHISPEQCLVISPEQSSRLHITHDLLVWNTTFNEYSGKHQQNKKETVKITYIESIALEKIQTSSTQKKVLWQTLEKYQQPQS